LASTKNADAAKALARKSTEGAIIMTPLEHAVTVRDALYAYNKAVKHATDNQIHVDVVVSWDGILTINNISLRRVL